MKPLTLNTRLKISLDSQRIPKRLDLVITDSYGTQGAFAESQGVNQSTVNEWIEKGWIVVDGVLYAPKRELK